MWKDIKSTKSFKRKLFFIFGDPVDIAREKKPSAAVNKNADGPLTKVRAAIASEAMSTCHQN